MDWSRYLFMIRFAQIKIFQFHVQSMFILAGYKVGDVVFLSVRIVLHNSTLFDFFAFSILSANIIKKSWELNTSGSSKL